MKINVFLLSLLLLIINLPAYAQTLKIIQPVEQKNKYQEGTIPGQNDLQYWKKFQLEIKNKNIEEIKKLSHFPIVTMWMLDEPGRNISQNDKMFAFGKNKIFNVNVVNSIMKTKKLKIMQPSDYNFDNYKLDRNAPLYYCEFQNGHLFGQLFFTEMDGRIKLFAIHEYEE